MGTAVRFAVDEGNDEAVGRAVNWLHWVDRTFSVYRPDSEILRLRRGEVAETDLDPEVKAVLERCTALAMFTDGPFDHRPDEALDPSAYVKGWAIERAAALLNDAGITRFYIDAGGDIALRGSWKIGIKHPADPERAGLVLNLNDEAIATSGTYERGDHIWGANPGGLASVSVIGPELGTADALSTALFSGGRLDAEWLQWFPGYKVVGITHDLRVLASAGVRHLADHA